MSKTHLTETRFRDFALAPEVLAGLEAKGFHNCTPIQAKTIPIALLGKDIAGQAQTGTGKTIAFLTAMFHRLVTQPSPARSTKQPRALILAPTRELAVQIHNDAKALAKSCQMKLALIYGGDGYDRQRQELAAGADVVIGTTGRVIDFMKQGELELGAIEVVVLDEADRMFDLGFIKDIRYLFRRMPAANQRLGLLFSATLSLRVQELAFEQMNSPEHVHVEPEQMTAHNIKEELFYPSNEDKLPLLQTLLEEEWPERAIVFANTKHRCEAIHNALEADDIRVGLLTGDVPQKRRLRILEQFTAGEVDVLVATDVAARGLHIPAVTHVFNYDLPDDCEDYVHRIGRTGRAGASGHAISLACEEYVFNLPGIEKYIGYSIPVTGYRRDFLLTDLPKGKPQHRQHRHGKPRSGSNGKPAGNKGGHRRRPPRGN